MEPLVPKFLLAFAPQVPDQPVGVEGILRGHAPTHDGIKKGLPLSGVETQHLGTGTGVRMGVGGLSAGTGRSERESGKSAGADGKAGRGDSRDKKGVNRAGGPMTAQRTSWGPPTHLDVPSHSSKKGRQGLVSVTLQLPPGLAPSTCRESSRVSQTEPPEQPSAHPQKVGPPGRAP